MADNGRDRSSELLPRTARKRGVSHIECIMSTRRRRTTAPQPPSPPSPATPAPGTPPSRSSRRAFLLGALAIGGFGVAYGVTKLVSRGPSGMKWIPGGEFTMGSADPTLPRNERPAHRVSVDGFWLDATEVTNAAFREFVEATGYVTTAEKKPEWEEMKRFVRP